MPPVTPSPHRFLAGRRHQSPSHESRAQPSTLRNQTPNLSRPEVTSQRPAATNPSQFAHTPRFNYGKPTFTTSRPRSPANSTLAQALRASTRPVEDVQGSQQSQDGDDEMLLDTELESALPTTESTQHIGDDQTWTNDLPFSPKRRRLDHLTEEQPAVKTPARPIFKHPATPAGQLVQAGQQFTRGESMASTIGDDGIRRPTFLRSSLAPLERPEPLPEAFSPHRRGEKFVPGGMAATVQQWVIETGQASRRGQRYVRGEDYALQVKVEAVTGRGPLFVEGRQLSGSGDQVKVLLVFDAKKGTTDLPIGSVIGIRAPTWDVEFSEENWAVGIDWKVVCDRC